MKKYLVMTCQLWRLDYFRFLVFRKFVLLIWKSPKLISGQLRIRDFNYISLHNFP